MIYKIIRVSLIFLCLVVPSVKVAARTSVLEDVLVKQLEDRTEITFKFNQPTTMVFYTIGNPPQIIADIIGNAFTQSDKVRTVITVDEGKIKDIKVFGDPSLGDEIFYGIDFLIVSLEEKVSYTSLRQDNKCVLYVANSPDVKLFPPAVKLLSREQKPKKPEPAVEEEMSIIDIQRPAGVFVEEEIIIEEEELPIIVGDSGLPSIKFKDIDDLDLDEEKWGVELEPKFKEEDRLAAPRLKTPRPRTKRPEISLPEASLPEAPLPEASLPEVPLPEVVLKEEVKTVGIELQPKKEVEAKIKRPQPTSGDVELARQWRRMGYDYQKTENYIKAADCYKKAIALYPDFACAHNDLGISYYYLDAYKKAVAELNKAIEIDPKYLSAYTNLALVYEEMGEAKKAIACWQKRIGFAKDSDAWTKKAKRKIEQLKRKR